MAYLLILVIGLVFIFGMIGLLVGRFRHDTAHRHIPQQQHNIHFFPPVAFIQYSDRIRAMQDRALDLLEEEPLRRYTNLGVVLLAWFMPAPEDDGGPVVDHRLGPQDPLIAVPRRNQL